MAASLINLSPTSELAQPSDLPYAWANVTGVWKVTSFNVADDVVLTSDPVYENDVWTAGFRVFFGGDTDDQTATSADGHLYTLADNITPGTPSVYVGRVFACQDRTVNVASLDAPGFVMTLPEPIPGKARDLMVNLTVTAESVVSAGMAEPAPESGSRSVSIDLGLDALGNITTGKNLIMATEIAPPSVSGTSSVSHWYLMAKHEDFSS